MINTCCMCFVLTEVERVTWPLAEYASGTVLVCVECKKKILERETMSAEDQRIKRMRKSEHVGETEWDPAVPKEEHPGCQGNECAGCSVCEPENDDS